MLYASMYDMQLGCHWMDSKTSSSLKVLYFASHLVWLQDLMCFFLDFNSEYNCKKGKGRQKRSFNFQGDFSKFGNLSLFCITFFFLKLANILKVTLTYPHSISSNVFSCCLILFQVNFYAYLNLFPCLHTTHHFYIGGFHSLVNRSKIQFCTSSFELQKWGQADHTSRRRE